jgi:Restriction endonuclease
MSDFDWHDYEEYIYEHLAKAAGPGGSVQFDQKLPGLLSGTDRQIDVLVKGPFAGEVEEDLTAIVDCKHYARNIDVTSVEAFLGLVEDVDVDLGFLITSKGFSKSAKRRGEKGGIRLKVIVAEIERIPRVYFPPYDEAYYSGSYWESPSPLGPDGALIEYIHVEESAYPRNPEIELEWLGEPLASDIADRLDWDDDEKRAQCGAIVLTHHLGREPTSDEVQEFLQEIAWQWEGGQEWVLYVGDLHSLVRR